MEISLEAIISIATIFFGGGGIGAIIGWRSQKKKARAEAQQAEAEAEKAKFEATQANTQLIKDIQGSYQQLAADLKANLDTQQEYNAEQKQYISELKQDRQHLREERDEMRGRQDKLEQTVRDLQFEVARNSRMVAFMRPLLCGRRNCPDRIAVTIPDDGAIEPQTPTTT